MKLVSDTDESLIARMEQVNADTKGIFIKIINNSGELLLCSDSGYPLRFPDDETAICWADTINVTRWLAGRKLFLHGGATINVISYQGSFGGLVTNHFTIYCSNRESQNPFVERK
ncbi:MAG: hypothetical protein AAB560_01320 [Patescibacteria group bacterium]